MNFECCFDAIRAQREHNASDGRILEHFGLLQLFVSGAVRGHLIRCFVSDSKTQLHVVDLQPQRPVQRLLVVCHRRTMREAPE